MFFFSANFANHALTALICFGGGGVSTPWTKGVYVEVPPWMDSRRRTAPPYQQAFSIILLGTLELYSR
jgi:hypothetical protein